MTHLLHIKRRSQPHGLSHFNPDSNSRLSCPDRFSTLAAPLNFTLEVYIYSTSLQRVRAVHTEHTGPLHGSFQAYIGLSRQPESLILDNKISLPFKSCQITLESRPPQPRRTCYNGRRLTINPSVLAWVSSFRWNMVQNLGSWVCGRSLYSQILPVQEYYDPLWKWRTVKREKKKETLCVNNHGHQASPEWKPGRQMSLVKRGQIERIRYKSSHFEIQRLVLYGSDQKRLQLMSSCDGPSSPRWAVYRISCSDKCVGSELNLWTYSN